MKTPNNIIGIGSLKLSKKAKDYVNQALDNNRLSYGPFTSNFESEFAKLHQRKFALFCNSGTSALQVALHALKKQFQWKDGDEVLVPSVTFIASSNVVLQNRLNPVFVDIESDYFEMDPYKIEQKITSKTRAIMPVHLFGQPCDMTPIMQVAKKYNLKIIEDSCEAMFAKYQGKTVGSWGEAACFSTYISHLIITGVGGIAVTNDNELAVRIKSLYNHGRDGIYLNIDDDDDVKDYSKLFQIVDKRFSFVDIGYSYRATELEAAIGLAYLEDWQQSIKKRKHNANYLIKGLTDLSQHIQLPKIRPQTEHVFMLFPIIVRGSPTSRDDLIKHLEVNKIETRLMMPLLNQPVYVSLFGNLEEEYPVAKFVNNHGFIIGCHPDLTKDELDYIIFQFHEFFKPAHSFERVW